MIRLALLSYWHVHAGDYARDAANNPDAEVVAVWDDDTERGSAAAEGLGVPFTASLDDVLGRDDVDGVIVTTATTRHRDVIPAAARAGKHIFTEKVLGVDGDEAREIAAAIDDAGVIATVALRWLPEGAIRKAVEMVRSGALGQVIETRVRIAHNGSVRNDQNPDGWLPARFYDPAAAGGGMMIDLGAHPIYLTRLVMGMPRSLFATYGSITGRKVEDIGVVTMAYAGGGIGVAGTSSAGNAPMLYEVFGTEGALRWDGPGTPLQQTSAGRGNPWRDVDDVPANDPIQFDQFIEHVKAGTRNPENLALAVDLSVLIGAANESARTGTAVPITPS